MLVKQYFWTCVYWVLRSEVSCNCKFVLCTWNFMLLSAYSDKLHINWHWKFFYNWKLHFRMVSRASLPIILCKSSSIHCHLDFPDNAHVFCDGQSLVTHRDCGETVQIPPAVRIWPQRNIFLLVSLLLASVYVMKGSTVLGKLFSFLQNQVTNLDPAVQWSYPHVELSLNFGWSLSHVFFYHKHQLVLVIL